MRSDQINGRHGNRTGRYLYTVAPHSGITVGHHRSRIMTVEEHWLETGHCIARRPTAGTAPLTDDVLAHRRPGSRLRRTEQQGATP